jgi:hypothetical protein
MKVKLYINIADFTNFKNGIQVELMTEAETCTVEIEADIDSVDIVYTVIDWRNEVPVNYINHITRKL